MSSTIRNNSTKIKWIICILMPICIMLIPTNETFTEVIRLYAAVTLFGITMFLFELMHAPMIAMTLAMGYPIMGVCSISTALSSWGNSVVYQSLCVLLILEAVNNTTLLNRLAYNLILKVGGSYVGILFGMGILGIIVAVLIPSATSAILVIGIGYGLCMALNLKSQDKAAVGIMFMAIYGVTEAQNFLYNPHGNGTAMAFIGNVIEGFHIGYVEIILDNIVFIPMVFVMAFMFSRMFKSKNIDVESLDVYKQRLEEMGKINKQEKYALGILLLMIAYLVSSQWHGKDMTFGYIVASILLYLPFFQIADAKVFKRVDLGMPLLVASCMAIGTVGTRFSLDLRARYTILDVTRTIIKCFR